MWVKPMSPIAPETNSHRGCVVTVAVEQSKWILKKLKALITVIKIPLFYHN